MPSALVSDAVPTVSIVVPVYNEEAALPELRQRIELALAGIDFEIVLVDDGSTDGSAALVDAWCAEDGRAKLVKLSRNFGMESAMSAGLDYSAGEYVALMHADLQDPPELIPAMLDEAEAKGADVVYARRIGRDESLLKRSLATIFYGMMERLARTPYQGQAGDFRLMSRRVVDAVRAMPERRRFLRGMVAFVGHEQVPIEYRRDDRHSGRGASYPALFRLAIEALTAFSDVPLAVATYVGIGTAVLSAVAAVVVGLLAIVGVVSAGIGVWILVVVLFLGGIQLVSIGVLGRYVARVHEQTLQRPLYLVDRATVAPVEAPRVAGRR